MKIMSIRLPDEMNKQLETRALRLGIPPAVLARAFIKGSLDAGVDLMEPPKTTAAVGISASGQVPSPSPTQRSASNRRKKKRG